MVRAAVAARLALGIAACVALPACGDDAPAPPVEPAGDATTTAPGDLAEHSYERSFVFASLTGDSLFVVPWLLNTSSRPDTVIREARAWLARSGTWDAFYSERWGTPPTRAPARILPHGGLSLVVREGDAVDGIVFEEGPRRLELVFGGVSAAWAGPRGEVVELVEGAAYLSDQRVEGVILDMARASAGTTPPGGDWALLMSGDSVRLVLTADGEHGAEAEPIYRAWADLGDEEQLQWPEVRVDWLETQAFPPSRRDVPVSWRIWSADALIEGRLEASSSAIQAGEGPGPLLPVRALFEVVGEVTTPEGEFPVRGLFVHERR